MFKKVCIIIAIVLVGSLVTLCIIANNKQIEVGVIKKSYNNVSEETDNDYINIPIYLNQQSSYITDLTLVSSASIHNEYDTVSASVIDISLVESTKILGKTYYKYNINCLLSKAFDTELLIDDAYLKILYTNGRSVDLGIGNISLYKRNKHHTENDLSVTNVLSTVKTIDANPLICGIALSIHANKEVTIKQINVLDSGVIVNGYTQIDFETFDIGSDVNDYLDAPYSKSNTTKTYINQTIRGNKDYLITLGYLNDYRPFSFALEIIYEVGGTVHKLCTDKLILYNSYNYKIDINDFCVYEYEYY